MQTKLCLSYLQNMLHALAMSSGLVNEILFSITAEDTKIEVLFRDISFLIPFQVFFKSLIYICVKITCKICLFTSF